MKVLALDIATQSGIAVDHPDGMRPICTTFRLPDVGGPDDHGPRLEAFEEHLCDLMEMHQPTWLAYEAPLVPHGDNIITRAQTVLLLIKLAGVAELVGSRYGCRRRAVNLKTVKKHFAGSGNADKDAMRARCGQLRWSVRNDDESDAAGLWCYVKSITSPMFAPMATPLFARAP